MIKFFIALVAIFAAAVVLSLLLELPLPIVLVPIVIYIYFRQKKKQLIEQREQQTAANTVHAPPVNNSPHSDTDGVYHTPGTFDIYDYSESENAENADDDTDRAPNIYGDDSSADDSSGDDDTSSDDYDSGDDFDFD